MKLNVRTWGKEGSPIALLMHGITSSSTTWSAMGPALAERGYQALAPDFRGHGESPRADSYAAEEMANDIIEAVPHSPALAIGNSLGGWVLALIVDRLRPRRAVYEDPAWELTAEEQMAVDGQIRRGLSNAGSVARVAGNQSGFDPKVLDWLLTDADYDVRPRTATTRSLVIAADPPDRITTNVARKLHSGGFDIAVVNGAGHVAHGDDLEGVLALLDRWIASPDSQRWFPEEWAERHKR